MTMLESISVDCRAEGAAKRVASIYAERGVVLCKGLLEADTDFSALREAIRSVAHMQAERFELPVSDNYSRAVMDLERVDHALVAGVYDIVNSHPEVYALAGHSSLQNAVAATLAVAYSGNMIVTGFQLRIDLPRNESELLGWHRDIDYFRDFPEEGVVLWLPLEDVTADSGGISVIPQRLSRHDCESMEVVKSWPGRKPHKVYEIQNPDGVLERLAEPVKVTCSAGDGLLFSMMTVHRSETNVSKDIRWTLQYRYYPALRVAEAKLDRSRLERR